MLVKPVPSPVIGTQAEGSARPVLALVGPCALAGVDCAPRALHLLLCRAPQMLLVTRPGVWKGKVPVKANFIEFQALWPTPT